MYRSIKAIWMIMKSVLVSVVPVVNIDKYDFIKKIKI